MKIYTFNSKVLTRNSKWLKEHGEPTPPTPSLPPYTIRLRFTEGTTPEFSKGTLTQVSSTPNIWDLTYENSNWESLCESKSSLVEVIDANTTGVTNMSSMFRFCTALTSISLFDTSSVTSMSRMFANSPMLTSIPLFVTSNVTDMESMFEECSSLTTVPLIDTSNVTNISWMLASCSSLTTVPLFDTSEVINMSYMFFNSSNLSSIPLFNTSNVTNMNYTFCNCYNVQSGSLALYQQASTQATPPSQHTDAFKYCGRDTVTGAAELAQIPSDWGGTAS